VAEQGVPVVQINTNGGCHLEARQIMAALPQLPLGDIDVLVIENVGNLVCPVEFDLGEDAQVLVTSLPEGDDKPLKYPASFMAAQAVVVNKLDLAPYLPVSIDRLCQSIAAINGRARIMPLSCVTGEGLEAWLEWIRATLRGKRERDSLP
jgi:hydrogenase nickel incorporation protein HypB